MSDQLTLSVNGATYLGFQEASVTRSLKEFCPKFELTYVDRWEEAEQSWPITPGSDCQVDFGSKRLITGYVNRISWEVGDDYRLSSSGRSKVQDILDSSATNKSGHWKGKTITEIAGELCEQHGIDVIYAVGGSDNVKFKRFDLDEGETVFDAIDRMAKLRGLLVTADEFGAVMFINTDSPTRYVAIEDAIVISKSLEIDDSQRFSEYRLKAQTAGDNETSGKAVTTQNSIAKDPDVVRYRPMVLCAQGPGHKKELEAQARYERNIRAGQSASLTYEVMGILAPDGEPWAPGMAVSTIDDTFGIETTLLCDEAEYKVGESTLTTRITLVRPEAFSINDYPTKAIFGKHRKKKVGARAVL